MDKSLLRTLNGLVEAPVVGEICWLVAQPWAFALVVLLVLAVSARKDRWLEIPGSVLAVLITDPVCSRVLKPIFARPRPCAEYEWVLAPFGCGAAFSMPSCHAANIFAVAMVLNRPWAFGLAAVVALARTVAGVHYPSDLAAGAVIGLAAGWVIRLGINQILLNWKRRKLR